jgi:hypothetical protein
MPRQDQVECHGEEPGDQDLASENAVIRKCKKCRERREPEDDLEHAPTVGRQLRRAREAGRHAGCAHASPSLVCLSDA